MKRRIGLLLAATGIMVLIAALAAPKGGKLLLLEWAAKGAGKTPPIALLIELGLGDAKPTSWNGRATITGANVVRREGYGFTAKDKLIVPDAWQAASHRPTGLPKNNPVAAKVGGTVPAGIVLHLAEVKADASLTLIVPGAKPEKLTLPLKELLAGQAKLLWDGTARVRRISATTVITRSAAENDFPAAAYGPDGALWVAYIGYHLLDENRRTSAMQLQSQPANFRAYDTPTFGDQLFVKYCKGGKWSAPMAITDNKQDLVKCAIAVEKDGTAWVIYSAHRSGKHDVYVRPIGKKYNPDPSKSKMAGAWPGPEEKLRAGYPGRHLSPLARTNNDGEIWGGWQAWVRNPPDVKEKTFGSQIQFFERIKGKWKVGNALGLYGNNWSPAIAVGPDGETAFVFDYYRTEAGDYDVMMHIRGDNFKDIATSSRFEARPSICYDPKGRLWIAYEEGPELWGKDSGPLVAKKGEPLYGSRSVRVVCLQDGKLFKPAAELPTSPVVMPKYPYSSRDRRLKFEKPTRYSNPALGLDGKGRLWLTYRQKMGNDNSTYAGAYWLSFARRLDGDHWTEPIELHRSDGTLDCTAVVLPHKAGGVRVIHNGDGRWSRTDSLHNQVYESYVDLPGDPVEPKLMPHEPGKRDEKAAAKEQEQVERIRKYRIEAGGKKYQLLRGEFHRHTEFSWDGETDGALEDMFRYAIDAAALDWIGNADHDAGDGREYSWWLIQKFTDAYHVPNRFTPVFCYERSVQYPHGHRNCVFARRGIRTLPRLVEEDPQKAVARVHGAPYVHADDTKMLYRYLHELNGVCASHTSASAMGTDWRDNDPAVEPIVEIYQGDRMSYEMEGAPRAGYDPATKKFPANIAGWYPKGFINLALEKGYRLGFQSSSDHWSTHTSFCVCLAERHDREAIVDAMRKRHTYAATDNIILDVRSGNRLMGDEWKTAEAPALDLHVVGTASLAKVEILKDSQVVHTFEPKKEEFRARWVDPKPLAGVHYYYVRVQQTDAELAWGSPMWIEYAK